MKKSITALALWRSLANSGLQEEEATGLAVSLFEVMKEPIPPSPALRREARAFNTPLQDFWAYGHRDPCPFPIDSGFDLFYSFLEAFSYELRAEMERPVDWQLLAIARWHALKGDPYSHTSTAASSLTASDISAESPTVPETDSPKFAYIRLRTAQPTLLRIYYCLKKAISCRCQLHLRLLQDCTTSVQLLSTYVTLWNSYTAGALRLHEALRGYTDLLQALYEEKWVGGDLGPDVSVVRMMALAWRRKVFAPLEPALNEALLELLQLHRANVLFQVHNPSPRSSRRCLLEDPEGVLLQSAFQAYIDLSVHENSVLFLDHSQYQPDFPYLSLHTAILDSARLFLTPLADPGLFQRCSQADLKCLKRLVPASTYREVERVYAAREVGLWQRHFIALQASPWMRVPPSVRDSDLILNSEFGLMLFSACPHRASILSFIEYLLAVDPRNRGRMERFVELVADLPGKYELEDEKVDFEAGRLRCSRELLQASGMFSLWRDVRTEDLQLLSLREEMQICD